MPQSLANIPVHLIWSTKNREPFIKPEIEKELFSYMASIFRAHESPALTINGTADHVHNLIILSRTVTVAQRHQGVALRYHILPLRGISSFRHRS